MFTAIKSANSGGRYFISGPIFLSRFESLYQLRICFLKVCVAYGLSNMFKFSTLLRGKSCNLNSCGLNVLNLLGLFTGDHLLLISYGIL